MPGFWNKASQNADIPSLIPHERWAIEAAYAPDVTANKMYVRFAGFLPGVEAFDADAFRSASASYSVSCLPGVNAVIAHGALVPLFRIESSKRYENAWRQL